jgi:hypothetical protein
VLPVEDEKVETGDGQGYTATEPVGDLILRTD